MRQFLDAGDLPFAALEQQATGACVVFQEQTMPPGSRPATARVGFEVNEQDRSATLLVDRGIQYAASGDDSVSRWLSDGRLTFPSFRELRRWIQNDLRSRYNSSYSPTQTRNQDNGLMTAGELTDLQAVAHHLPANSDAVPLDEEDLIRRLAGRIRGQDDAIRLMARHVRRHLARKAPKRPATLMALGPTGVGKTTSAECLPAAIQSQLPDGGAYNYLRLDMSEYQERHRISQLLGAPQGYVGYGDGAQLVDALAANPRTVILFDEIEKAHPDILRTLMNAMDAGRLSSSFGVRWRTSDRLSARDLHLHGNGETWPKQFVDQVLVRAGTEPFSRTSSQDVGDSGRVDPSHTQPVFLRHPVLPAVLQNAWQVLPGILVLWFIVIVLRGMVQKLLG